MKVFKRSLAVILALCMMLGVVPFTAFASENTSAYSTGSTEFMRVFHLDCGRKYFTVDQIKELIDAISAAHYTHMELAIGNDGLRFLLDDMSVTANGTTYASETVKSGIKSGNAAYAHSGEWSQDEMDTIIAYADSKNIEIIPLVNTPGHMDAILAAMSACGISGAYNGSARTVDITNAYAVAFTKALLAKYMDYFAGKGCTYFNIGADEYANDIYKEGGMGWAHLISVKLYDEFITYINGLVDMATARNLKPIAFNDGIYYNENTSSGTFRTDLIVSAWTAGWPGFNVASVDFLAGKGHKILNTNDAWYYVLGRASDSYGYSGAVSNSASVPVTKTVGNSSVTPIGAMQCVWCDTPSVNYSSHKNNVMNLITTLSANNTSYFKEEPKTVTDSATSVSVTAVGLGEVTVEAVAESDVPAIEGAEEVKAYNITPVNYTGSAVVSIPVPAGWNNVRGGVMASANGAQVLGITGTLANGVFTFTVPHFSTVVVYEVAPAAVTETVNVTVGVNGTYTHTDNSGYYTSYEGLNTAIATVALGGSDGTQTEVEFKKISITYRSLLNSNATKYQTEYYVLDNGKYYPLYVTRTSTWSWGTPYYSYKYYYDNGTDLKYFDEDTGITTLSNNVGIDIYQAGDTVTIPAKTTITFTGVKEGTTSVQVGNTLYNVTVVPAGLSKVAPLTVNYWVTSHPITADGATGKTISALDNNVYTEEGALLTSLIPPLGVDNQNASAGDHKLWHVRLQHEGAQQTSSGSDDKTAVGEEVVAVRYYGGKWKAMDANGTWLDVSDGDVLTAYYLMKSPLTDEVDSLVKDWGFQFKDGQKYWQYFDESTYAALSGQVIYEDATMNPADDSALIDTTFFFNYWSKGQDNHATNRDIGFFHAQVNDEFEIYKITTMHGECSVTARSDNASAASVDYGNPEPNHASEVIVWEESSGTVPEIVGKDGDDALQWNGSGDAILIRIYVRQKKTEDALTVVYYDEKFGDTLYTYNINVPVGVNFNNGIDPEPEVFATDSSRIDVTGTGITNTKDVKQVFQTDLSKVPEAVGKYKSELYKYTGSEISTDGKILYLYYNIDTSVLEPNYVVDFGLPIVFPLTAVIGNNQETMVKNVTVVEDTRYGKLIYDAERKEFKYTPQEILKNIDVLSIGILFDGEDYISTTNVGVTPATTVYYEEGFLFTNGKASGSWTHTTEDGNPNLGTDIQAAEVLGESTHYGYDSVYAGDATGSDGTCAVATVTDDGVGASTSFTFTGTGFELYANSKNATGIVSVLNKSNKLTKLYRIDTKLMDGDTGITTYADGATTEDKTYYSLPIISETDLEHGEYTVTIKQNNGKNNGALYIDGVRIINTIQTVDENGNDIIGNDNIYYADKEDNPDFYELRDMVINKAISAYGVGELTDSEYVGSPIDPELKEGTQEYEDALKKAQEATTAAVNKMAGQVYNNANGATAIIIDESLSYADSKTLQDLLDNGPKNELYLSSGQTLSFSVNTNRVLQLGLKAPKGEAIFKVTVDGTDKTVGEETTITNSDDESETWGKITSTVDMFYKIADQIANSETTTTHTVTITVKSGLLSVTKLKICDDPNAAFVALTQEDIENALLGIYGLTDDKTPVEPEEPAAEADAVLAITLTDGKKEMGTAELTAVGAEGEKHTFTAEEILNAVLDAMPDLYKVSDESAIADVAVKYGETGKLTVDIELEFEFDMDSWWRQVRTLMNRIFTIIADAGKGGSITNEGSADVKFRKDITYTITPDEGYEIESVIVDGKDVGAVSEYTFRRVRNDHRISVTFKEVQ